MTKSTKKQSVLETVEPIGDRVLIRKDEDRKVTKVGIHLPDKIEIPTLTGRVVTVSTIIENDPDYPIQQYDKVLFNPKNSIPVDFEGDNRLYVVPIDDVVAVFRRDTSAGSLRASAPGKTPPSASPGVHPSRLRPASSRF